MLRPVGLLLCLLLLLPAGCSENGLVEVTGRVTLDDKPLEKGTVSFVPADGKGPSAAAIIEQGAYSVEVAPGAKKVEILGYKSMGKRRYDENDPSSPMLDINQQIVPERFNAKTELTCEVGPAARQHDFAVQSQ